eukprot:SM000227S07467  [mRNA]  locus=s227:121530:123571:+ [translate_table: standard]
MRWHGTYDSVALLSACVLAEGLGCRDQPAGAEAALLKATSHRPLEYQLEQLADTGKLPDLRKVQECDTKTASCVWQAATEAQALQEDYDGAELLTAEFMERAHHVIGEDAYSMELEAASDPSWSGPVSPPLLAASNFGCSPSAFQAPPYGFDTCHSVSSTTSTTQGSPLLSSMDDDGASVATARLLDWPADDAVSQPPYMTEPPARCAPLSQAAMTASEADALPALKTKSFLEERRAVAHQDAEQSALAACQPQQGTAAGFLPLPQIYGSFDHGLVKPQGGNIAPADVIHEWQVNYAGHQTAQTCQRDPEASPFFKSIPFMNGGSLPSAGGCGTSSASSEGPQHYVPDFNLIQRVSLPNEDNQMKRFAPV